MKSTLGIISDDILFWNLITPLLNRNAPEIEIHICSTYQEINSKIEELSCDLIIIDGGLSRISSIELIQFIRMSKHAIAPIWFFPEILSDGYIRKVMEIGANRIIHKPFDPYVVTKEIESLLSKTISLTTSL